MEGLKEANRRLKESNDRLIAENSRLEEELQALQRRVSDRDMVALEPAAMRSSDPGRAAQIGKDLLIDEDEIQIDRTERGLRFRIPDRVFFGLGQASLTARGVNVLNKVARLIKSEPRYANKTIRVDGHTDDTPIRKVRALYPSNWELSTARACAVVRHLVTNCGLSAHKIYPAGFSYYRPVSSGRTAKDKSQNRRVEILVLDEDT